ncbi:hypothetical protein BDW02DRAFT_501816 [Decorospora gaudefroyi]|uniref:PWI domain-containing protein n=1 Tax=Decorospora gaudefroyi TaxID=184978 RepID=A0A6A5K9G1_9PLEO|nr:hypothetical protein BDW02DRAFT_501816 [Decorospora gaudefroyi]
MALSIDQKRLKATKFPPEFDKKVDIEKVNIDLMKKWIANKITDILGDEDDIVVETCYNLIEQNQFPKIKEVQIQLTGFLNKDTAAFCKELWDLMLSAQDSPMGVPRELLEAKKLELQKEQLSKAAAEARRAEENAQNAMIDSFRQNERSDRPERGRGGGGGGRYRGNDGGLHRPTESEISIYRMQDEDAVVDVEDVATDLMSVVALLQTVVLHLHHPVVLVPVAHLRQNRPDRHRDVARDLCLAVPDVLPVHEQGPPQRGDGEISHGLRAKIAGGYPGIFLGPILRLSSRAHQRPGCDHDHAYVHGVRHVAADVHLRALLYGLQVRFRRGDAGALLPPMPIRTALVLTSRSESVCPAPVDRDRPVGLVILDAGLLVQHQVHQFEESEARRISLTFAVILSLGCRGRL